MRLFLAVIERASLVDTDMKTTLWRFHEAGFVHALLSLEVGVANGNVLEDGLLYDAFLLRNDR